MSDFMNISRRLCSQRDARVRRHNSWVLNGTSRAASLQGISQSACEKFCNAAGAVFSCVGRAFLCVARHVHSDFPNISAGDDTCKNNSRWVH